MKLYKFIQIKNVGKFQNYSPRGDMSFSDINLIYGENAKGKTTLCSILRSLKSGENIFLREKKRAGTSEPLFIQILLEGNHTTKYLESAGRWTTINPEIEIFDSFHVNNNVYSGDHVDHTHKKNLYYLVIGDLGVTLARELELLDEGIKEASANLKQSEISIRGKIHSSLTIDQYINLTDKPDIEEDISRFDKEIRALEESDKINNTEKLSGISIPEIVSEELEVLLSKSLDNISNEAEISVRQHCLSLGGDAENWVKQGVEFLQKDDPGKCPFCGQSYGQAKIIHQYQDYFNQAYIDLKNEITGFCSQFEAIFSDQLLLDIQKKIGQNSTLLAFWETYNKNTKAEISIANLKKTRDRIFTLVRDLIGQKSKTPLDKLQVSKELQDALSSYEQVADEFDVYNNIVQIINGQIDSLKLSAQTGNLDLARKQKSLSQDIKDRNSAEISVLCNNYLTDKTELDRLKTEKQNKSAELRIYSENILDTYRATINEYLVKFGTEFEIVDTKTSMQGGKPSANYMLKINDVTIPLGTTDTLGEPCFRTVLSEGDKNSLAFALFMAQLKLDPNISQKTIIIDDPITSLDIHRRIRTYQEIREITGLAKQTIILSHDAHFLKLFWENLANVKTFQIIRDGNQSTICEWDVHNETMPSYLQDYYRLDGYISSGDSDLRGVVRCIRPVLEGYLRFKFPKNFGTKEWLGDFLEKIKTAESSSSLAKMQPYLGELSAICSYSSRYHHQQNPLADKEVVNDIELKSYVIQTLSLIENI